MEKKPGTSGKRNAAFCGVVTLCLALLLALSILSSASASGAIAVLVPERPEMIDITAYETLELKANALEQSVRFDNLLENNCWLVITLTLEDGTELWKSEELMPGQVVRNMTLNEPLAAGKYENAVISYQHWSYDEEKIPLNGAELLVTLIVAQ